MIKLFLSYILLLAPYIVSAQSQSKEVDKYMRIKKVNNKGIEWHDPREAPFRVSGLNWLSEEGIYRRMPNKPDWEISKAVNSLANNTSGAQIHFRTNSRKILLRVKLTKPKFRSHQSFVAKSSFDCYVGEPGNMTYVNAGKVDSETDLFQVLLSGVQFDKTRRFTINFPLYNGVEAVEIGVVKNSILEEPKEFEGGSILIYGTSITQGCCSSRPGLSYSNILSRKINREVINWGFSGSGKGEIEIAKLMAQVPNKSLVVLDYEANAGNVAYGDAYIGNTLEGFIAQIRKDDKNTIILVASKITYPREQINLKECSSNKAKELHDNLIERRDLQKAIVEKFRKGGDKNIYFLDGTTIYEGDPDAHEYAVDNTHPNDAGFLKMAASFEKVINELLKNNKVKARKYVALKDVKRFDFDKAFGTDKKKKPAENNKEFIFVGSIKSLNKNTISVKGAQKGESGTSVVKFILNEKSTPYFKVDGKWKKQDLSSLSKGQRISVRLQENTTDKAARIVIIRK